MLSAVRPPRQRREFRLACYGSRRRYSVIALESREEHIGEKRDPPRILDALLTYLNRMSL